MEQIDTLLPKIIELHETNDYVPEPLVWRPYVKCISSF